MKDLKKYTFKTLAVFLSILMIVYLVPTFVFAEWIDGLSSGTSGENDEPAGRASDTYEMTERREENVKHFHCQDGTNIAVQYDMPVHYLDNGEWKDIDNTLAASGSDYSTSNARIKFAKKITGNESLFTLHDGNRKIVMSLDGARKKTAGKVTSLEKETDATETKLQKLMRLDKLSSKITYENILDGTDLEYIVFSSNVKENIIVKKKLPSYLYTFTISLNNLTAAVCGDGSVRIYDPSDDETVYVIPRGYMVDADGARSDAVSYSVSDLGNGKYKFTVTADAGWINSDGRAFPVKIDPSLNTSASDYLDVYVNTSVSGSSVVDNSYLRVGGGYRAYLKIGTLPELPEYAYITDAKVQLYCRSYLAVEGYIAAYRVTGSWTSSMVSGGSAGTLYSKAADYQYLCEDDDYQDYSWNITEIARAWYAGESNYGVAFENISSDESAEFTFGSSESTVAYERPKLIVTYRDQLGVEDYWSFISQSAGGAGIGSLNLANGNLVFSIGTLTSTDSLMPFTPTLIYNSMLTKWYYTRYSREVPYSFASVAGGFKTNISQCIVPRTYINESGASETFYVYTDADGTEHAFFRSTKSGESNIYYDEDGLKLKLTVNSSDFTITDTDFTVYTFTKKDANDSYTYAGGYLTQITDVNGNTVAFDCNSYGRPTTVKLKSNGASSYITQLEINYTTGGVISYILNPTTQQAVHLFYSSDYNTEIAAATRYLRKIVVAHQKDGNTSASNWTNFRNNDSDPHIDIDAYYYYEYDSTGHLLSAEDHTHKVKISYTYDSAGRVISATEYGQGNAGQTVKIAYGTGYTDVETSGKDDDITTTADNIITRYVFDKEGRCVTCYSTDKSGKNIYGAKSGQYEDDNTRAKNSIKQSSVISDVATNFLVNPGFEVNGAASLYGWSITGAVGISNNYNSYNREVYDRDYMINMSVSSGSSASIYQSVYLKAGTYTLSGDIYRDTYSDVDVLLKVQSPSGNVDTEKFHFSRVYDYPESAEASLTFDVTSDGTYTVSLVLSDKNNTAAVSSISVRHMTLARSVGFSTFSRIENGSFERSSGSTITSWTVPAGITASAVYAGDASILGNSLRIMATDIENENYVEQTVYRASDSDLATYKSEKYSIYPKQYRISGRAMADKAMSGDQSIFGIRVTIKYFYYISSGGSSAEVTRTHIIPFNNYAVGWQFASDVISTEAGKFVREIKVSCVYSHQEGTAYFDDIAMCFVGCDETVSSASYDYSNGKPIYIKTGNNYVWYKYNSNGMVEWKISRRDAYNYTYSESVDSRITEIKHYVFGGDANAAYYGFDPNETSKTLREDTQYNYNDYGQPTSIYVYSGGERTENYMSYVSGNSRIVGALVSEIDTTGVTYRYFYDENTGELLASGNVDSGNGMAYTYDAVGRMTQAVPATVTLSSGSEYTYSSVSDSANVSYTYDTCGRLGGITTDTTTYTFTYDIFGNSSSVKVGGSEIASYTYGSNNGKLETLTYGNGVSVKYVYGELDRVSKVCYNAGSGTSFSDAYLYTYDSNGNLNKVEDLIADKVTIFRYDSRGRLCEYYVNDSDNELDQSALCLRYDEEGRLKTQIYTRYYKYGSGSISYFSFDQNISYNEIDGTLSGCVIDGDGYSRAINYSYDDFGRLSTVGKSMVTLDGDGVGQNVSYTYVQHSDPDDGTITYNRVDSVTNEYVTLSDGASSALTAEAFTYTYDASGNITEIKKNGATLFRYAYDSLNQLVREDNTLSGRTYVYEYDRAGNIKSKKTYDYTTATTVSTTLYSTQTYTYGSSRSGDVLTALNGSTISYDGALNPLSYVINGSECTLTWTQGRRLASISGEEEGTDYTYTYNDEGIRTGKTVDGVEHIYHLSGTQILSEEWTENGVQHLIVYSYDASGSPISMTYRKSTDAATAAEVYFLASNPQGDITYIYDIDGNRVVTYNYDAWGNILSITGTKASTIGRYNPFRYRGYYYDNETGFYYLNSRYYDPAVGRWISPEPNADQGNFDCGSGLIAYNVYSYCANNPVLYADPDGESILLTMAIGFGVGALISGAVKLYQNHKLGKKWYDGLAISMLAGGVGGAISCVSIPGVSSWVCAAVFGAAGNVATKLILGEIKSIGDLTSAIAVGASAGLLGKAASELLIKGVTNYFGSLTKANQKAFLSRIGQITNRQLSAIRQQIKQGLTPEILKELVEKYGYDVLVSAFVSSTASSAK